MVGTRSFLRASGDRTSSYMLLQENHGGEVEKVVLTGEAVGAMEEDDVDGETSLQWKKVLQNHLLSSTRGPRTLGTTWPVTRSMEEGAHRRSVEVRDGIWHSGRRSGARATKPRAKGL
jgi:hypothetical protein